MNTKVSNMSYLASKEGYIVMHYKKILVATDLSDTTYPTIEKAIALAKSFNAEIFLVHVIEPIPAYGYPGIADLESPLIDHAKEELDAISKKYQISDSQLRVEFGSVKTQILHIADTENVDLIIVGTHGRHGLGPLLGSSASAIVNGAGCDVLTIRHE